MKTLGSVVIGICGLAGAMYALSTGQALVTTTDRRGSYETRRSRTVTRQSDPMEFYLEVVLIGGGGAFLLYRAATGKE